MVTKPNTPMPDIKPAEIATKASHSPKYSADPATSVARKDVANSDKTGENKFTLPDKISAADIKGQSFRYGGGRSAGNRSLADNTLNKVNEQ
jgi:hypothetical protein